MSAALLGEGSLENLAVHVVWSSQLGAEERHVESAAQLMLDPRVRHYWDADRAAGAAFQEWLPGLSSPAWDVWMLFAPDVIWEGRRPPEPTWWEHQLGALESSHPELHLDPVRFARKARELAASARGDGVPSRGSVAER